MEGSTAGEGLTVQADRHLPMLLARLRFRRGGFLSQRPDCSHHTAARFRSDTLRGTATDFSRQTEPARPSRLSRDRGEFATLISAANFSTWTVPNGSFCGFGAGLFTEVHEPPKRTPVLSVTKSKRAMQVVNQLIKHNKNFDLLVVPGANHPAGRGDHPTVPYGDHKRFDFFVQHLLGVTPPRWNRPATTTLTGSRQQHYAKTLNEQQLRGIPVNF